SGDGGAEKEGEHGDHHAAEAGEGAGRGIHQIHTEPNQISGEMAYGRAGVQNDADVGEGGTEGEATPAGQDDAARTQGASGAGSGLRAGERFGRSMISCPSTFGGLARRL